MEYNVRYLSCGVNGTPLCCDWNIDGVVCYAAHTSVILYHPKGGSVIGSSTKVHTKRITCVRWIQSASGGEKAIISTGSDGKTVIWCLHKEKNKDFIILKPSVIIDHDDLVLLGDGMVIEKAGQEYILVVTASTDTLNTWLVSLNNGTFEKLNTTTPPSNAYIMSMRLYTLTAGPYPILLCGGHNCKVYILTSENIGLYKLASVLSGHEDWITALNLMTQDNGDILLATGSKDSFVRIWTLSHKNEASSESGISNELKLKRISFDITDSGTVHRISVKLDAVLAGHEGMVSEVCWAKPVLKDQNRHQPLKLLTCSKTQDRSIIIWQPRENIGEDKGSAEDCGGLWVEVARLGEVGGNMEGYFTCCFGELNTQVLGCNFQGGLHLWNNNNGIWKPQVVVSGHFNQVSDISWDHTGRYLLSTSKDQTTRLHAPWLKHHTQTPAWHEIGRPQVHGYDLFCITRLGSFKFASGAEEKVIRGFSAPGNFIANFGRICGVDVENDLELCGVGEGASVPSLGLSNKAVLATDLQEEKRIREQAQEEVQAYFTPLTLSAPPTEDQLMQNTLWPEAAKLYGHGNELMSMAATSDGRVMASSCRAANIIDAQIILWDTDSWQKLDSLEHHRLTVTHLSFSPDDRFLLAVSRDRTWSLYQRQISAESALGYTYKLLESSKRKDWMHGRVIWRSAWLPDSTHFLTASRDKTVAVWAVRSEGCERLCVLNEDNEVTAIAVAEIAEDKDCGKCFLVATGLVCGAINIHKFFINNATFSDIVLHIKDQHHDTVRCLSFRPKNTENGKNTEENGKNKENENTENGKNKENENTENGKNTEENGKNREEENGKNTENGKNSVTLASCSNDTKVMLFEITVR